MGCGGSTNKENEVKRRRGSLFTPKVRMQIGTGVKILDQKPRIVIVFGGPGSKKGKIIENIARVYDFEVINMESIIIEELGKKVENPEPGRIVQQIQNKLKTEQELLRLDTVLKMLMRKLETVNVDKLCVIDLVPNFKWMLNNSMLIKDCTNELRYFEERFPVSFVLNLVIDKDKVLDKLEIECAKHSKSESSATNQTSGGQSDEVDTGRTQKRVVLYNNSIKHFLEYFQKKDKIVNIDVSCGIPELVWSRMCEFFSDYDFKAQTTVETVIVYAFDSRDLTEINVGQYSLTVVTLKDIATDPSGDAVDLIDQVCKYVDNAEDNQNVFVVDCSETTLSKTLEKKKSKKEILFTDEGSECKLGKYCSVNLTDKEDPADLRAVSSIHNEICLFVQSTPKDLCKWVSQIMAECRKQRTIS